MTISSLHIKHQTISFTIFIDYYLGFVVSKSHQLTRFHLSLFGLLKWKFLLFFTSSPAFWQERILACVAYLFWAYKCSFYKTAWTTKCMEKLKSFSQTDVPKIIVNFYAFIKRISNNLSYRNSKHIIFASMNVRRSSSAIILFTCSSPICLNWIPVDKKSNRYCSNQFVRSNKKLK